jgi:DNA-binding XRE family transcriptional regulator
MNREEFCQSMRNAKEKSGIKFSQLSFQLQVMPTSLHRLEKGSNSFSVKKAIEYLNVTGHAIALEGKHSIVLKSYDLFPLWLTKAREQIAQSELAKRTGITPMTIANVESAKNVISIDFFLKIVDELGYTVNIQEYDANS